MQPSAGADVYLVPKHWPHKLFFRGSYFFVPRGIGHYLAYEALLSSHFNLLAFGGGVTVLGGAGSPFVVPLVGAAVGYSY
jgi:hypothetical protein